MLHKKTLLYCLLILVLFSCTNDSQKKNENEDNTSSSSHHNHGHESTTSASENSKNGQEDGVNEQKIDSVTSEMDTYPKKTGHSSKHAESTKIGKKNKDYVVTLNTSMGAIDLILYDETPIHKKNFLQLVSDRLYDGVSFHRVINAFMIQGGGIDRIDTSGKYKSRKQLPAEFVKSKFHKKGALSAARLGDSVNPEKKSSWCQFYIVQGAKVEDKNTLLFDYRKANQYLGTFLQDPENSLHQDSLNSYSKAKDKIRYQNYYEKLISIIEKKENVILRKQNYPKERIQAYKTIGGTPHLDDQYTVFGEVLKGLDIVDKIATVKTVAGDQPVKDVKIVSAKSKLMLKSKITKIYGYPFN